MISSVNLFVAEPESMAKVLQSALGVTWWMAAENPKVVELSTGATMLLLCQDVLVSARAIPRAMLDFHVDDVDAAVVRFERAGESIHGRPVEANGMRWRTVELDCGILIRLIQSVPPVQQPASARWQANGLSGFGQSRAGVRC